MENYDSLFENQSTEKQANQPFDKEAWAQRKQEERALLYETIDGMTDLTLSSPEALSNYLNMQSQLGRTSVSNTLLILAQKPDASYVMSYDDWQQKDRAVKRNEKALQVLEASGEYQREDGTMKTNFDVKRVFDVSQTSGKPLRERTQAPTRSRLKALVTDTLVPVKVSDSVSQDMGALYSVKDNTVYVARDMDGAALFAAIACELVHAENVTDAPARDAFISSCAANIVCTRYGIDTPACDRIPEGVTELDTSEKRAVLGSIRKAACDIMERLDKKPLRGAATAEKPAGEVTDMEDKRVIEVDEYQQRLIIGSLNEKRNELVAQGRDTDFVDETMLDVMDAPTRKEKKRYKEMER